MPSPASADSPTSTFDVQIRILPSCAASAGIVPLGAREGAVQEGIGIVVTCTENRPWTVSLRKRAAEGPMTTSRKTASLTDDTFDYVIYDDSSHSIVWVDQAALGSGQGMIIPVLGRHPVGQAAGSGIYRDAIAVTVVY